MMVPDRRSLAPLAVGAMITLIWVSLLVTKVLPPMVRASLLLSISLLISEAANLSSLATSSTNWSPQLAPDFLSAS